MAQNLKNWRVLTALALGTAVAPIFQNCSEVSFVSDLSDPSNKGAGLEVVNPPPTTPGTTPPDENVVVTPPDTEIIDDGEGGSDPGDSDGDGDDVTARACDIDIKDIIVNVQFISGEANRANPLIPAASGPISLLKLVSEGITVSSAAKVETAQVRMVFNDAGHYILGVDDQQYELATSSHEEAGFKLRLNEGRVELAAGQSYLLKADALPEIRRQNGRCRLLPNWRGISLTAN